jgi:hypothetical protein
MKGVCSVRGREGQTQRKGADCTSRRWVAALRRLEASGWLRRVRKHAFCSCVPPQSALDAFNSADEQSDDGTHRYFCRTTASAAGRGQRLLAPSTATTIIPSHHRRPVCPLFWLRFVSDPERCVTTGTATRRTRPPPRRSPSCRRRRLSCRRARCSRSRRTSSTSGRWRTCFGLRGARSVALLLPKYHPKTRASFAGAYLRRWRAVRGAYALVASFRATRSSRTSRRRTSSICSWTPCVLRR